MLTIKESTTKHDLCINCGICKSICPSDAITLKSNKYNEQVATIDKKKCTKCGMCEKYCPQTINKIKQEAVSVNNSENPNTYGIENASYYLAWNENNSERINCASGGAITKFAKYLLDTKNIDGVVHVERIAAKRNEPHYKACLSTSNEELQARVSSAYQPIDFSDILMNLNKNKTYLLIGTPCIIRGVKKLFEETSKYKHINLITCALICSHNTNIQFVDYFADKHSIPNELAYKINMRNKDAIIDANNFNNHYYTENKDLLKMNRFESGWTNIWRSYYFSMNCCLYCSDFWGCEADFSVKDAWGEWAIDPLGKSIVVIRNKKINDLFLKSGLKTAPLDYKTMRSHQKLSTDFKQKEAYNKLYKNILSPENRRNGLFKFFVISKCSKFLYSKLGYKLTSTTMNLVEKIISKGERFGIK